MDGVTQLRARTLGSLLNQNATLPRAWDIERTVFRESTGVPLDDGYYAYVFGAAQAMQAPVTQNVECTGESQWDVLSRLKELSLKVPDDIQGGMRCFKCGSNDLMVEMRQTRAADEGMTQFVTCRGCGAKW